MLWLERLILLHRWVIASHIKKRMWLLIRAFISNIPWEQGSWGQHGAHLGPTGPRWAPSWPHELFCYLGSSLIWGLVVASFITVRINKIMTVNVCNSGMFVWKLQLLALCSVTCSTSSDILSLKHLQKDIMVFRVLMIELECTMSVVTIVIAIAKVTLLYHFISLTVHTDIV